jgi:hypothetical protein
MPVAPTRRYPPLPPFRQGDLDGFCGPYALINALRYLGVEGFTEEEDAGIRLLQRILQALEGNRSTIRRLRWGSAFPELERALIEVVSPRHAIRWSRPFRGRRQVTLEQVIAEMARHCQERGGVALIGLWGGRDHWTRASHTALVSPGPVIDHPRGVGGTG